MTVFITQPAERYGLPTALPEDYARYGTHCYLWPDGQLARDPAAALATLLAKLDEHSFTPSDHLIVTGDITLGLFAFHAMMLRGGVNVLRWDRHSERYDVLPCTQHPLAFTITERPQEDPADGNRI